MKFLSYQRKEKTQNLEADDLFFVHVLEWGQQALDGALRVRILCIRVLNHRDYLGFTLMLNFNQIGRSIGIE